MSRILPTTQRYRIRFLAVLLGLTTFVAGWYAWPRQMDGAEEAERALAQKRRFDERTKPSEMTVEERLALDRLAVELRRDLAREAGGR